MNRPLYFDSEDYCRTRHYGDPAVPDVRDLYYRCGHQVATERGGEVPVRNAVNFNHAAAEPVAEAFALVALRHAQPLLSLREIAQVLEQAQQARQTAECVVDDLLVPALDAAAADDVSQVCHLLNEAYINLQALHMPEGEAERMLRHLAEELLVPTPVEIEQE